MSIVDNKKAFFDYFIEERFEAGIVLQGWEVKAIRAGRAQIKEAYVVIRSAELYLIGAHITPLISASTHVVTDPTRTRKLLLNAVEIRKLIGKVEQKGFTLVPLNLHFSKGNVKCEIGARQEAARQACHHQRAGVGNSKSPNRAGRSPVSTKLVHMVSPLNSA
jgi:SsrA-binding protein